VELTVILKASLTLSSTCAPYVIQVMPYPVRVLIWVGFSVCGMLLVALSPSYTDSSVISQKLSGIVLASFSSGVRELSFLSLTHLYGSFSLAAWGSGIGGAGLIGAGVYVPATTSFGFSVRTTLLASACLPAIMVVNFFIILPRGPLNSATWSRESVASEAQDDGDVESANDEDAGLLAAEDSSKAAQNAANSIPRTMLFTSPACSFPGPQHCSSAFITFIFRPFSRYSISQY
jgi:battenin